MKSKHSFRLIILTFIVIAMSSQSFAASTKLVGTHKTNDAVILEYNDKGVHVTVYNDPKNANKRQIELIEKKTILETEAIMTSSTPYYFSGVVEASNPDCEVLSTGYISAWTITPHKLSVYDGATKGRYFGASNPQGIVVRQKYAFSGVAVSVSWPLGFSGSSAIREWVSEKYTDTWRVDAERDAASGTCLLSLFSVTVTDGSDVYVNNNIYKARYSIKRDIYNFI